MRAGVSRSRYNPNMRVVGIMVLKRRLTEYVRLAGSGETVFVTNHGRVVAELVPPRAQLSPPRLPVVPLTQLLRELGDDRRDR